MLIAEDGPPASGDYEDVIAALYRLVWVEKMPVHLYQVDRTAAAPADALLRALGSPHRRFTAVHVAGTKGKGSVSAMCAAGLRAAGLRVGFYTSPHLQDFRERIRVLTPDDGDGRIGEAAFAALYREIEPLIAATPGLTWFEIPTALAFLHFARQAVDVAVVEAGVGGRLDATNVVSPLVSVITTLGLDHVDVLGSTLEEIAGEKGGILKPGVPAVTAPQPAAALARLEAIAARQGCPLTVVGRDWRAGGGSRRLRVERSPDPAFVPAGAELPLALRGEHQLVNATVALAALGAARRRFPGVTGAAAARGLATVEWKGRLQTLLAGPGRPTLVVDCAHCGTSAEMLAAELRREWSFARLHLIFSVPADKELARMMRALFPLADTIVLTANRHPRAATAAELLALARELGFDGVAAAGVPDALDRALAIAAPGDLVCATGDTSVVGEVLDAWELVGPAYTAASPPRAPRTPSLPSQPETGGGG
ncbi:MAG TPA: Mur ligase family protein [Thermoanaerobaculia bacterium]|nr:Mur ligase family protein [Thermoanaerobaculia bacterium]